MITTANGDFTALCRSLRDHGADRSDRERHTSRNAFALPDYRRLGFNYRMTDIQGALGIAQLERARSVLSARIKLARFYDKAFSDLPGFRIPVVPEGCVHSYQSYVGLFAPEEPSLDRLEELRERRNRVMAALEEAGVSTRQGTHAPPFTHFYRERYGFRPADFPRSVLAEGLSISLPMFGTMTEEEVGFVVEQVRRHWPCVAS